MKRRHARGQRGLTLIEVLIALVLLAIGLLAMAPLFSGALKTNSSANQLGTANTLAREKLEELIGYPSTDPRLTIPTGFSSMVAPGQTPPALGTTAPICANDLPNWYNPSTGQTSTAVSSPGSGWFQYPCTRIYMVEEFAGDLTTRIPAPNAYVVKLVTVTVRPTSGTFPGLRSTTQSAYVRF